MKKVRLLHLFMLFCLPGLACGVFQTKDEEAPATAIAASIYSTMTAEAPPATLTEIPTLTPTETLIPTDTIVPSATLTDTPTNTQTQPEIEAQAEQTEPPPPLTPSGPTIKASVNTNCRRGPGADYKVIGYLLKNQVSEVRGRNAAQTWWLIENPGKSGANCWVWGQTTNVQGDISGLPTYHTWIPFPSR